MKLSWMPVFVSFLLSQEYSFSSWMSLPSKSLTLTQPARMTSKIETKKCIVLLLQFLDVCVLWFLPPCPSRLPRLTDCTATSCLFIPFLPLPDLDPPSETTLYYSTLENKTLLLPNFASSLKRFQTRIQLKRKPSFLSQSPSSDCSSFELYLRESAVYRPPLFATTHGS